MSQNQVGQSKCFLFNVPSTYGTFSAKLFSNFQVEGPLAINWSFLLHLDVNLPLNKLEINAPWFVRREVGTVAQKNVGYEMNFCTRGQSQSDLA